MFLSTHNPENTFFLTDNKKHIPISLLFHHTPLCGDITQV
jgi:hypothetical protein